MIDPTKITNFKRSRKELQEFLLFCIVAAGKNSFVQAKKLEEYLCGDMPFVRIIIDNKFGCLEWRLRNCGMGQYSRICRAFTELAESNLDLASCTVADLEAIHGIGPKTARFFILHTRPNQQIAVLDTHILKHMAAQGISVPKVTPSGKKYLELEQKFLSLVPPHMTVAEYDLNLWNSYA